ncbi:MAG: polymerase sigma factor, sigma-70 family [Bacteroidetes bacterium]|nr:polymerase sigma factor, sigma-70 family [Bacteroidota bacterium]
METELRDDEIITEVLRGNKEKYALLMRRYNQRLYRISKGYISDEAEIEDVMQEAYIRGFQHLSKFENRSQFSTWITKILINECLQRLKKINKKALIETGEENSITMNVTDNQNPETNILGKELKRVLERNIESLPEKYKVVFLMREVEQMSIEETSLALELSIANVKIRLNRAKVMLRESLAELYPVKEAFEFNLVRCNRIAACVLSRI